MRLRQKLASCFLCVLTLLISGCAIKTSHVQTTGLFKNNTANMITAFESRITKGMAMNEVNLAGFDQKAPNVEVFEGAAALEILRRFRGERADFEAPENRVERYAVWVMPHVELSGKKSWLNIYRKKASEKGNRLHFVFIFKDGKLMEKGKFKSHPSSKSEEHGLGMVLPDLFRFGSKAF